jgi:transcriptional regulator with XRE-family HTH domain
MTRTGTVADNNRSSRGDSDRGAAADSIGVRLAELRKEHRYSIRKLAERAGVSASLISDVERGKVEPSISTLKRLSDGLGTTLTYFFSEPAEQTGRVVRAGERVVLRGGENANNELRSAIETSGIRFELASPDQTETIEAIFGRYEVGASLGDEPVTHAGEEWGMVLKGRLKVWVGAEIHFLEPTEYIWIDTPKSF